MSPTPFAAAAYTIAGAPDLSINVDNDGRVTLGQIPEGYDECEAVTVAPTSLPEVAGLLLRIHRKWREQQRQDRQAGKG